MIQLRCCGGPFDGQVREVPEGKGPHVLVDDIGTRATYRLGIGPAGRGLLFEPASLPAYASAARPVVIHHRDRTYRIWPSRPIAGESRWNVADGTTTHILSMREVDVDTSLTDIEGMLEEWLVAPVFPPPRVRR